MAGVVPFYYKKRRAKVEYYIHLNNPHELIERVYTLSNNGPNYALTRKTKLAMCVLVWYLARVQALSQLN